MKAIAGRGLHTGAHGAVEVALHDGPVVVRASGIDTKVADLHVVDTARATTVANASGSVRIATVEHVFAALGGLGIHAGVVVAFEGAEAPLADGAARAYAEALRALGAVASPPPLRVVRDGVIDVGTSRYELRRNAPGDEDLVALEISVDFDDARIARSARWSGDAEDFLARISAARTFGFEHEVMELLARGLASHVAAESVVVIGKERIFATGAPFTADEPVRHKLLDLIGDLYLYGGPPRGTLLVTRPGHAATHEVMRRALDQGLVMRGGGGDRE